METSLDHADERDLIETFIERSRCGTVKNSRESPCSKVYVNCCMRAAIAALPHEVPRLAVTAQVTDHDIATLLDRRIERMKAIEAQNGEKVISNPKIEAKPNPMPRIADKRYRRI